MSFALGTTGAASIVDINQHYLAQQQHQPAAQHAHGPAPTHELVIVLQLRKDTRTELPLWLAKALSERHITNMNPPAAYGEW